MKNNFAYIHNRRYAVITIPSDICIKMANGRWQIMADAMHSIQEPEKDRKTWDRDCSGMSELELITWKSTHEALEEIQLLGVWEVPHEFPYTPIELESPENSLEAFLFWGAFEKIFTWFIEYSRNVLGPKYEQKEIETANLYDELPFADHESRMTEDEISTLYSHLPFPGDQ